MNQAKVSLYIYDIIFMMKNNGFTLAELLISLAILGVIATFTIPKVLNSQQDSEWNSIAKEFAGTLTGALFAIKSSGDLQVGVTESRALMDYVNYTRTLHNVGFDGGSTCHNTFRPCWVLHNGVVVRTGRFLFCQDAPNNAVLFQLDPDYGKPNAQSGNMLEFILYLNGRITTIENRLSGTKQSSWGASCGTGLSGPSPGADPDWFSWN